MRQREAPLRVYLAEDSPIMSNLLTNLLAGIGGTVVGHSDNAKGAIRDAAETTFIVVLSYAANGRTKRTGPIPAPECIDATGAGLARARRAGANTRRSTLTLFHGAPCKARRLRRREAMLRETPPPPTPA